ncbi:MAG: hypothetical protein EXR99_06235 [Gemmataceae bacterium]|nr:hypothetical protein [Gemmataceae bacterium]
MLVMADYVYNLRQTEQLGGSGTFSSFGIRTQFDF